MKSYIIKIREGKEKIKEYTVRMDSKKELIKWLDLLSIMRNYERFSFREISFKEKPKI